MQSYCHIRQSLKLKLREKHKAFLNKVENDINANINVFWNHVNKKRKSNNTVQFLNHNNEPIENSKVAECFAKYFSSVFSPGKATYSNTPNVKAHIDPLRFQPIISSEYAQAATKKLKPKKAAGVDGIPPYIIKGCSEWLETPLLHIFNLSLKTGIFPSHWKLCLCTPIHKDGDQSNVENYRCISILCAPAKAYEQTIYNRVCRHVENSINESQHGFIARRSVNTNLVIFSNYIFETFEMKAQLDTIYTDFSKAFDKVNHDILIAKLADFGIEHSIFRSYLRDRQFILRSNGHLSQKYSINSGVPQGSNLGPLLFLLFINDLPNVLKYSKCLLYADFFKFFRKIATVRDCVHLQKDIDNVLQWSVMNQLSCNLRKCHVISFTLNKNVINFNYLMSNANLIRNYSVKDLGVTYSSKFSFSLHIEKISSSALKMLGFVIRNPYDFNDIDVIKLLYNTLVRSKLDYASVIWANLPQVYVQTVEKVQNKFLRYLYFKEFGRWPDFHSVRTTYLRTRYNVLPLCSRHKIAATVSSQALKSKYHKSRTVSSY
nr:unnamed protein product [Callosobruchus chinensis]